MVTKSVKTKERILAAALSEFSSKGFAGTRVDQIASRAKINKERIYAYFGSKKNLFSEVLKRVMSKTLKEGDTFIRLTDKDIPNLGPVFLDHYFKLHQKYPYFQRLISWANLEAGSDLKILRSINEPEFQHLKYLYRKGQTQGLQPKRVSFEAFFFVLLAVSFFYQSNKKTLQHTLGVNLANKAIQSGLKKDILNLVINQN